MTNSQKARMQSVLEELLTTSQKELAIRRNSSFSGAEIDKLPEEMYVEILMYFNWKEVYTVLRLVCTKWWRLGRDSDIWKRWASETSMDESRLGSSDASLKHFLRYIQWNTLLPKLPRNSRECSSVSDGDVANCEKLEKLCFPGRFQMSQRLANAMHFNFFHLSDTKFNQQYAMNHPIVLRKTPASEIAIFERRYAVSNAIVLMTGCQNKATLSFINCQEIADQFFRFILENSCREDDFNATENYCFTQNERKILEQRYKINKLKVYPAHFFREFVEISNTILGARDTSSCSRLRVLEFCNGTGFFEFQCDAQTRNLLRIYVKYVQLERALMSIADRFPCLEELDLKFDQHIPASLAVLTLLHKLTKLRILCLVAGAMTKAEFDHVYKKLLLVPDNFVCRYSIDRQEVKLVYVKRRSSN